MSLGYACAHDFKKKVDQAKKYDIRALEIFYADLETMAKNDFGSTSPSALGHAADRIYTLCADRGIEIMCLQPFGQYEGLRDRKEHAARIEKAKVWFDLAYRLHTDLIAIPASFLDRSQVSDDLQLIIADLTELADLGAQHNIRFSFEALAWSTYIDTWEQTWDIVQAVDRSNFGLCLDTFNIAGRIYADPTSPTGKTKTADEDLAASLQSLRKVDVNKVFYIQVVDGERLASPLQPDHEYYNESQPWRMMWSRNGRLFYGEEDRGAYLPVRQILQVIIGELGYRGWVSMEYFNNVLGETDAGIPEDHARRAQQSYLKIRDEFLLPRYAEKT